MTESIQGADQTTVSAGEGSKELGLHPKWMRWLGIPLLKLAFGLLFLLLGPLRVRGKYRVPRSGGLLILANHRADVDPIVVQLACPRAIHFMAKSELFEMKVVGPLLRFYKAFPVRRGEPDKGAIRHCVELLKAGEAVCVFPEGELSEQAELLPLKPGVALIVRMSGAPVICIGLKGTNRVMPYGTTIPRPSFRRIDCEWGELRTFERADGAEAILSWAEGQLRMLTGQQD